MTVEFASRLQRCRPGHCGRGHPGRRAARARRGGRCVRRLRARMPTRDRRRGRGQPCQSAGRGPGRDLSTDQGSPVPPVRGHDQRRRAGRDHQLLQAHRRLLPGRPPRAQMDPKRTRSITRAKFALSVEQFCSCCASPVCRGPCSPVSLRELTDQVGAYILHATGRTDTLPDPQRPCALRRSSGSSALNPT